ncbi:MarR family winged helix-turn-helix transcriptional regulator [Nocardia sp. NPDC059240]|uniref:MarR family winged helix-turn-helix transcriptional regulator n=1 Tax=Nocardia sp. NPDC059240 TaxID=3346786 RepID=UPI0036875705
MSDAESDVRANAGYLVWRLSTRWRATMDRVLAPHGLTQAQYSVLAPLYGLTLDGSRPSQRQLADVTGLDAVYISKLVRALEGLGLLTRTTSAADPRAVELALTERGVDTAARTIPLVRDLRDRLTAPLGGNDGGRTAELTAMLRALLDAPEGDE